MRVWAAVTALFAGLVLAGCGADAWERPPGLDIENRILTIGNSAEPLSLDPHKASGSWENNIIGNMFMGLTTEGARGEVLPGMATSWSVSEDGLTWTFILRRGVVWSDGHPFTAHDFVFAFRRLLSPETIAEYAYIQYVIENAEAAKKGEVPVEQIGVSAPDDHTLVIRLEHPAPYLPQLMEHYTAYPIPAHIVRIHGNDWIQPENVVTNGAFRLQEYWANYMVHLIKNPRFFDAQNVCFRELFFYPTADVNAAMRRIRQGEIAWNVNFPGSQRDALDRDLPGWINPEPYLLVNYFSPNMRRPPFSDDNVRRALNMVIDREFIVREIRRTGDIPAYSMVPPNVEGYPGGVEASWRAMPMDQRKVEARRLLEEAGFGLDNPLTFEFSHRAGGDNPRIAVIVQRDWESIAPWIRVTLRPADTQLHYANLRAADHDIGDGGWIADFNDAKNFLKLLETRTGAQNYSGYSNPVYDALMLQSDQEKDAVRRGQIMAQAEQIMIDDDAIFPVFFGASRNIIDPRITGFYNNMEDTHRARWMCVEGLQGPFIDDDLKQAAWTPRN